ncbi:unnamed protein product [Amoebophrya sp. A25]|nr:unnamed protein product [Amoebophrya sp. A25]|eukprot:GSA25T00020979001.1
MRKDTVDPLHQIQDTSYLAMPEDLSSCHQHLEDVATAALGVVKEEAVQGFKEEEPFATKVDGFKEEEPFVTKVDVFKNESLFIMKKKSDIYFEGFARASGKALCGGGFLRPLPVFQELAVAGEILGDVFAGTTFLEAACQRGRLYLEDSILGSFGYVLTRPEVYKELSSVYQEVCNAVYQQATRPSRNAEQGQLLGKKDCSLIYQKKEDMHEKQGGPLKMGSWVGTLLSDYLLSDSCSSSTSREGSSVEQGSSSSSFTTSSLGEDDARVICPVEHDGSSNDPPQEDHRPEVEEGNGLLVEDASEEDAQEDHLPLEAQEDEWNPCPWQVLRNAQGNSVTALVSGGTIATTLTTGGLAAPLGIGAAVVITALVGASANVAEMACHQKVEEWKAAALDDEDEEEVHLQEVDGENTEQREEEGERMQSTSLHSLCIPSPMKRVQSASCLDSLCMIPSPIFPARTCLWSSSRSCSSDEQGRSDEEASSTRSGSDEQGCLVGGEVLENSRLGEDVGLDNSEMMNATGVLNNTEGLVKEDISSSDESDGDHRIVGGLPMPSSSCCSGCSSSEENDSSRLLDSSSSAETGREIRLLDSSTSTSEEAVLDSATSSTEEQPALVKASSPLSKGSLRRRSQAVEFSLNLLTPQTKKGGPRFSSSSSSTATPCTSAGSSRLPSSSSSRLPSSSSSAVASPRCSSHLSIESSFVSWNERDDCSSRCSTLFSSNEKDDCSSRCSSLFSWNEKDEPHSSTSADERASPCAAEEQNEPASSSHERKQSLPTSDERKQSLRPTSSRLSESPDHVEQGPGSSTISFSSSPDHVEQGPESSTISASFSSTEVPTSPVASPDENGESFLSIASAVWESLRTRFFENSESEQKTSNYKASNEQDEEENVLKVSNSSTSSTDASSSRPSSTFSTKNGSSFSKKPSPSNANALPKKHAQLSNSALKKHAHQYSLGDYIGCALLGAGSGAVCGGDQASMRLCFTEVDPAVKIVAETAVAGPDRKRESTTVIRKVDNRDACMSTSSARFTEAGGKKGKGKGKRHAKGNRR